MILVDPLHWNYLVNEDTELRLKFWRDGSTMSERLAAAILTLAGYESIDPQSPLGGPDAGKDILCTKGGIKWVAACYFPISPVSITKIKNKFLSDLTNSPPDCSGIVFLTNQDVTPTLRLNLIKLGKEKSKEVEVYHL